MKRLCERLGQMGESLSHYRALEFFARTGAWQTMAYIDKVKSLTAWEIDCGFEAELRRNLPQARVIIGDSFKLARQRQFFGAFEFIVIDNPQGIFEGHCEHFEALHLVRRLLSPKGGVLVFNVNRRPYNYEQHPEWQKRRKKYYGRDAAYLDSEFLLGFYTEKLLSMGLDMRFSFEEQRNKEYLSYLVFGLARQ